MPSTTADTLHDEHLIRRLIEQWAVYRDAGDWDRFATCWHPDGVMMATWFQGPYADFIRVTREGWDRGVSILHFLGAGERPEEFAAPRPLQSRRGPGPR